MDAWFLGDFAYNRPSNQSQLPEIVGSGRVAVDAPFFLALSTLFPSITNAYR